MYVCVYLFGCQNKSTCFQKLKSSNVFYVRARQMRDRRPSTGTSREAACNILYILIFIIILEIIATISLM